MTTRPEGKEAYLDSKLSEEELARELGVPDWLLSADIPRTPVPGTTPTAAAAVTAATAPQPPTPAALEAGFRVLEMSMREVGGSGAVLWRGVPDVAGSALSASLPRRVLRHGAMVSRALTFTASKPLRHLFMVQRLSMHGQEIELTEFDFGFVIPGSVNTWEQVIAHDDTAPLPPDLLTAGLAVEIEFYDKDVLLCTMHVQLSYES